MKNIYVYVSICIVIVSIGIFLMYQFNQNSVNSYLQDKKMMTVTYIPKLSQDQAFQVVKSNILKHIPRLERIHVFDDMSPTADLYPDFKNYPIRLVYENSTGMQFLIQYGNYSTIGECDSTKMELCFIPGKERSKLMLGKLVYIVPVDAFTKHNYLALNYFIDATDGDIIYSNLSQYIPNLNKTGEYNP